MKFNNRNVHIRPDAVIGQGVKIGDNTTIYPNVVIGDDVTICNDCIIGEPLSSYYTDGAYINPKTIIGNGSLIRSHAIIYCGSTFGAGFKLQSGYTE